MLKTYYNKNMLEVGVDEAGRGPMLVGHMRVLL